MADVAVVSTKLEQIEQYYGELQTKQSLSEQQFLGNITEQRAVERMFENAISACIDLSQHIATTDFGYEADSSKGAVDVLSTNSVLDDDTAIVLTDAIGFRNILAHEYGDVNPRQVYTYLQNELRVYEEFSRQVATWFEG